MRAYLAYLKRKAGSYAAAAIVLTVILFMPAPYAYAQCTSFATDGLVGHWKLDEASGTFADSSGNGNTGTQTGGVDYRSGSGMIDYAAGFDGVDDYITLGTPVPIDNTTTITAWIKHNNMSDFDAIVGRTSSYYFDLNDGGNSELKTRYFTTAAGNVSCTADAATGSVPINVWTHVAVVYPGPGEFPAFYKNGQKTGLGSCPTPLDDGTSWGAGADKIGQGPTIFMNGGLDDIRIYNRALSADEIATLYALRSTAQGTAGTIAYNEKFDLMQYCDGTDWRMMGIGSYNPPAVHFDGSNDYLHSNSITGFTNDKKGTVSFWYRQLSNPRGWILHQTAGAFSIVGNNSAGSGEITIKGKNTGGTQILSLLTTGQTMDYEWHHYMASWDMSDSAKRHIYIDGIADSFTVFAYTDDVLNYTTPAYAVGSLVGVGEKYEGDLADFWLDFGTYIDLSIEQNRRKFISENGMPMYLGADGSFPTGSPPDIFLTGDVLYWQSNKGTGGDFTENGEITYSSSQPGNVLINSGNFTDGLVGHWKLDEASGNFIDSAGTNDGTQAGGVEYASSGVIDKSAGFDGVDDVIRIAGSGVLGHELDFTQGPFSISTWFNCDTIDGTLVSKRDGATANSQFQLTVEDGAAPYHALKFIADGEIGYGAGTVINCETWYHGVVVVDEAENPELYVNGVQQTWTDITGSRPYTFTHRDTDVSIGARWAGDPTTGFQFDGTIDDVRIYNRALSDADIANLYRYGVPGKLQYNADFNVMEYFNGAEWVAMGPIGGTPPTTGLAAHWKLDEASGTNAADSVASADGTLTNFIASPGWDTTGGILGGTLDFVGDNDYIDLTATAGGLLQNVGGASASLWFRPDTIDTGVEIFNGNALISFSAGAAATNSRLAIAIGNTDEISVGARASDAEGWHDLDSTTSPLTAGQWYHVVGVADYPNDILYIYLNGELLTSGKTSNPGAFAATTSNTASSNVAIGAEDDGGSDYFDGLIDDVRVYSRVLTAQEIKQLYYYGLSGGLGDVSGNCASPNKPEGSMIYNTDNNVLQYCNGESWIGVGK
jgi:hypothetical protein